MTSRNCLARQAAVAWLLTGVTSTFIGVISVRRLFIVGNDAAATGQNILRSETLFRVGVVSELVSQTVFLLMALTFYQLLKDVQRDWARTLLLLMALSAAVGFVNCLNLAMPLILLRGGPTFADFTPAQLEQLAYAFLRVRAAGGAIESWFQGLWLIPLGMLVARSGFFPRILGLLVVYAGVAHASYAAVLLIAPAAAPMFFNYVTLPSGAFELALLLWLLIKGAGADADAPQRDR